MVWEHADEGETGDATRNERRLRLATNMIMQEQIALNRLSAASGTIKSKSMNTYRRLLLFRLD